MDAPCDEQDGQDQMITYDQGLDWKIIRNYCWERCKKPEEVRGSPFGKAVKSQGDGQGITTGFSWRIRTNVKDHYLVSREKVKLNANRFPLRTSVKGLEIGKNPTEVPLSLMVL